MIKKIFIAILVVYAIGVIPWPALAGNQYTRSWSSQADWSEWSGFGQDLVYSSAYLGLVLKSSDNIFKSAGNISYHFSTGGLNQWGETVVASKNTDNSNRITIKYSTEPVTITNLGVDDPKTLQPSSDLYLSVTLTSAGQVSPILNSLSFSYQNNINYPKIYLEKKIFPYNADNSQVTKTPSATYDPFNKAMVQIRVVASGESDGEISLRDYLPKIVDGSPQVLPVKNKDQCNLNPNDTILGSGDFQTSEVTADYIQRDSIKVTKNTTGYFCYNYTLSDVKEAKNDLNEVKAVAYEKEPDNSLRMVASANYYLMIKGFGLLNSNTGELDENRTLMQVDDLLSYSFINILYSQNGNNEFLGSSVNYIYKRGLAGKSRGGNLYELPVVMTNNFSDPKDRVVLSADNSYILYNPVFYLFGNIFSGSQFAGSSLDLGSRSAAVTTKPYDSSNKNNSESSLYNYNFDPNSVVYWDKTKTDKNAKMEENIKKLMPQVQPDGSYSFPAGVCNVGAALSFSAPLISLNNSDCSGLNNASSSTNPSGTAWYYKVKSGDKTIDFGPSDDNVSATRVTGNGTVIIDFSQAGSGAKINISKLSFDFDAAMGLIVINGGNVEFGPLATQYNGIVFAPGK